jgi:molybdate transport system permease protein
MDWSPLWLSLRVAGWATVFSVLCGLAIAYPLARRSFFGRSVVEGLTNLPLVLPPTVLGYALLVMLGRRSPIGHFYEHLTGQTLVFTWQGAVVAACIASLPLFISHARVALAGVDSEIVAAARIDGASPLAIFRFVLLPIALPGLVAGTTLAFARAMGDFGATLMVAGDTPGLTQTMPLAIYDAVLNDHASVAWTFAAISAVLCLAVCILAARISPRH